MSQEKAAEIIDLSASREAAGAGAGQSAAEYLAATRKAAGLSLAAVSDATKVKIEHLEAIEASDASGLPIAAYAVGFVKAYARFLGLDEAALAEQFKKDIGADQPVVSLETAQTSVTDNAPPISEGARMVSIFGIIAILVFVFWIVLQITAGPGDDAASRTTQAPEQRVRLGSAPLPAPAPRERNDVAEKEASTTTEEAPNDTVGQNASSSTAAPSVTVATDEVDAAAAGEAATSGTLASGDDISLGTEIADTDEIISDADSEDIDVLADQSSPLVTQPILTPQVETPPPVEERPATRTVITPVVPEPVIVEAKLSRSIAPQYPNRCARGAEDLERVTVIFDVTVQGRAANIRVADTSNDCFNNAAVSTLRRWRFNPKTVDGAPRPDVGKQATLNFRR
ncbi:MAG: TonB family protein [Pseudomonadota bacterium]